MSIERISREELDSLVSKVQESREKNAKGGRIALISDIHSNYWALKAVLEDISQSGAEDIFCAGDVVGYGPRPNECCYLLRALQIPTVMGNHDYSVTFPGKSEFEFNSEAELVNIWTRHVLDKSLQEWLSFPPFEYRNDGLYIVHGSPRDNLGEYVSKEKSEGIFGKFFESEEGKDLELAVHGHTHLPYIKEIGDRIVVNPGSVGQPRDGNPRASYALVNAETELKRVEYDIEKTAGEVRELLLPEKLASRLFIGG